MTTDHSASIRYKSKYILVLTVIAATLKLLTKGELTLSFIISFFKVRDSAQSFLTVQVPLYVSYIYVTAPRGWASLEHHTEMEFSFFYDTVLWRTGQRTR